MTEVLVRAEGLTKTFPGPHGGVKAVEGVSFSIRRGETLGLVGESGCGKTTLGRTLLRLYPPTGGKIEFDGRVFFDETLTRQPDPRPFRREMQMIFQDPASSLDPRMTAGENIAQALKIHHLAPRGEMGERVAALLAQVGLGREQGEAYPHALSGGMQQRAAIARALAVGPRFLVCDEPVSALDVSIQAQILNVLGEMQGEMGLTYLFIGHDLSVVRHISHRIGVMYWGRLIELADSGEVVAHPAHPYTRALLAAVPTLTPRLREGGELARGELSPAAQIPAGCPFRPRCPYAQKACGQCEPALRPVGAGHWAACHLL